jgi:phosphoglycolate phosphatase-like HAD superfamily hydrolase
MIVFDHDGTLVNTDSPDFILFKGIKELLADLSDLGFLLSVWTARGQQSTLESLKHLNVANYFWEIYGHDSGVSKPHPLGLVKLTAGFKAENILHIGDSLGDVEGAKALGIDVIAACWNNHSQVEIFRKKTPLLAMTPNDCRAIIAKKFNVLI